MQLQIQMSLKHSLRAYLISINVKKDAISETKETDSPIIVIMLNANTSAS